MSEYNLRIRTVDTAGKWSERQVFQTRIHDDAFHMHVSHPNFREQADEALHGILDVLGFEVVRLGSDGHQAVLGGRMEIDIIFFAQGINHGRDVLVSADPDVKHRSVRTASGDEFEFFGLVQVNPVRINKTGAVVVAVDLDPVLARILSVTKQVGEFPGSGRTTGFGFVAPAAAGQSGHRQ